MKLKSANEILNSNIKVKKDGKCVRLGDVLGEEHISQMDFEKKDGTRVKLGWIILKAGIKRLRDYFDIKITFLSFDTAANVRETIIPIIMTVADIAKKGTYSYIWTKASGDAGTAIEVGEISEVSTSSVSGKYPISVLYKRGYGRAVLEYLGLYEFHAEDEFNDDEIYYEAQTGQPKRKLSDTRPIQEEMNKIEDGAGQIKEKADIILSISTLSSKVMRTKDESLQKQIENQITKLESRLTELE